MQQLGTRTLTVDGVTVFADHADPLQFWYLPAPVALARRPDNSGAFTFIKYRPAAVAGGAKGGGFAMFEVNLRLPPATEQRIRSQLAALVRGGQPRLSAVPFDEGTVRCIALDLEGSGGTAAPADAPRAPSARWRRSAAPPSPPRRRQHGGLPLAEPGRRHHPGAGLHPGHRAGRRGLRPEIHHPPPRPAGDDQGRV
ncbi:hypothetical protein ACFQU2_35420 [Siccirubricoccus deserti]